MNRREALKNIGITAGYIAVTPTVIGILQSCTSEIKLTWQPKLLSIDEAKALDQIVDLIIPETDIPGAKKLNVPMFIDNYTYTVSKKEHANIFKKGAEIVMKTLGVTEEHPVDKIKTEEYDALLAKYLKTSKEEQKEYRKAMQEVKTVDDLESVPEDAIIFNYLDAVRGMSIWGFKTSEEIAENVLAYLPVPGEQIGCESVDKLTKGKAWSL
ncbi:gluconate 2-dehydrogenase subunit 3 family protein [Aquimarina algicola]|uniref:Gluconate 2-dehydrogenase subunit 3 family protein n=1 Tax=Aquimarina algicola TaxID=2589995 RepID=A0A504J0Z2_9FLAO|nr:gluconate 2-dehydrogenase subunit 3 family protein [Aquimarina algicola]TPN82275.1 gluconate 2-dehydrogenase subunit 3 family protein [Aquimarina algicola]